MSSRLVTDLAPEFAGIAGRIVMAWRGENLNVLITCTRRSVEEQEALYAIGRTKPGRIVTWKKPGTSMHERGLALDFVPLVLGKPMWKRDPKDPHDPWLIAAQVAKAVDPRVHWGGDWKRFIDAPHLEFVA